MSFYKSLANKKLIDSIKIIRYNKLVQTNQDKKRINQARSYSLFYLHII